MKYHHLFTIILFFNLLHLSLVSLSQAQTPSQINSATDSAEATISGTPAPTPDLPPPPETGVDFTVSPSILLIDTTPGTSQEYPLRIRNNSPQTEALSLSLKKLITNPNGDYTFSDFDNQDLLPSWVQFNPDTLVVEPDTWGETTLTFSPGEEASLGYYFAILFNRANQPEAGEGEAAIVGAPSIIALADIESELVQPELQLVEFKTTKNWYDFLPVEFELTIQNTGNIHLQPFGNVFIDQGNTTDVGILTINESGGFILPGASRTFTLSWTEGFPVRVPDPDNPEETQLKWNWQDISLLKMGKFTSTALAAYDNGRQDVPLEAVVEFWVIPWQILSVITVIAIIILINLYYFFKRIAGNLRRQDKN